MQMLVLVSPFERFFQLSEIWLGTIAKFTFFDVMYTCNFTCAKCGAFTTKCTIHSIFDHLAAGLQGELALPSTGSWLPSRLSST